MRCGTGTPCPRGAHRGGSARSLTARSWCFRHDRASLHRCHEAAAADRHRGQHPPHPALKHPTSTPAESPALGPPLPAGPDSRRAPPSPGSPQPTTPMPRHLRFRAGRGVCAVADGRLLEEPELVQDHSSRLVERPDTARPPALHLLFEARRREVTGWRHALSGDAMEDSPARGLESFSAGPAMSVMTMSIMSRPGFHSPELTGDR
jgi:hypothetical protein